jgi:trk system potassium uptake protein TrkH
MTTVSAGGFANYDESFSHPELSGAIPASIVFMLIAGLPFTLLSMLLLRGKIRPFLRDPQTRLYFGLLIFFTAAVVIYRTFSGGSGMADGLLNGVTEAGFNVVAVMTGTGYSSAPYDTWGEPLVVLFLITAFMGGCAGSAACGMKMFRIEITAKALFAWSKRMVQPHRLVPVRYAGRPIDEDTLQSVMVFMFLYIATFMIAAAMLSLTGLDSLSAISTSASMVSNVGPALGPAVGPSGNFAGLTDFAKWVCAFAMLLGRLEFVAVFVVLTARFWRG